MRIGGYQPLSLIDYPGTICSIVFTQGCPFRCGYCHNPDLVDASSAPAVEEERVFDHLGAHKNMIEAVCITGGEPTIQPDLRAFIERVKGMGFLVKLDTNGVNPKLMRGLFDDGLLDYVAMDLKNAWARYRDVIRAGGDAIVDQCRETFGVIQESGVPHEFRTTVHPGVHTTNDFVEMAGYLKPGETYYIQETRFVKTLDPNVPKSGSVFPDHLIQLLRSRYPELIIEKR